MKPGVATLACTLMLASGAFAATPKPIGVDLSASSLIDEPTAERLWKENTPMRVMKLYPRTKFRFVSEVGGGFNDAKTCVVTARVMLLPVVMLPLQGRKAVYSPVKSATAFDAAPNLSREQCQDLARTQLKSAIQSVMAALASS